MIIDNSMSQFNRRWIAGYLRIIWRSRIKKKQRRLESDKVNRQGMNLMVKESVQLMHREKLKTQCGTW